MQESINHNIIIKHYFYFVYRMGCSHDQEGDSECLAQAEDKSYSVMSPFVHLHTKDWSPCSRAFISTFFK